MCSSWMQVTFLLAHLIVAGAVVYQYPGSLTVAEGTNVTFHCDISEMGGECSYIVWVQVGSMRKLTLWPRKTYSVHTNTACLLNIINANRTSVGIFYCALLNGAMLNMGNGSVLEISDPITSDVTLEVLVPVDWQEAPSSPVPLLCLVSGLDPSQARVYWEVEGKVQSSERLPEVQSEKPASVRVQLSVPGHTWAEGEEITCVMESTSGLKMNKTVSRMGMERSRQGMFLAISLGSMCILLSIVVIIITLYVCRLRHDPRKKRFQPYEHDQDGAQAYAKFAGAPLKLHKIGNPWRSPTGSLPALKTSENGSLSRPSDIIIHLRKQKYNADFDLSAKEGADTLAFTSLLEEKLMPALVYTRWIDPKNYVEVTRRWHAEHAPFPLNFFLPGSIQRQQLQRLRLVRGDEELTAGEEVEKELYRDAMECMNLISQRLGSNKFFFGDSPSSLDAFVFGYLVPILKMKLPNGRLQQHLKSLDNLSHFCSNILALYFPSEGRGISRKVSSQPEGGDADNEPGKRRKQLLSVLVALGAMLSYAFLTGIVAIQHVQQEALDHRSPGLRSLSSHGEEEDGEEEG